VSVDYVPQKKEVQHLLVLLRCFARGHVLRVGLLTRNIELVVIPVQTGIVRQLHQMLRARPIGSP
jgi:hypothetical protein